MLQFMISMALLFSLLIVGPSPSLAANGQAQSRLWADQFALAHPYKAASPEEVTRQFYNWYLARFPDPKRSNMATFRKYVTQSLMKRATAPDVDAVVFIDAQDTDPTWANNFTVSKATIQGQKATVQVGLNGQQMKHNLTVTLRREGGVWKIDDVKGSTA